MRNLDRLDIASVLYPEEIEILEELSKDWDITLPLFADREEFQISPVFGPTNFSNQANFLETWEAPTRSTVEPSPPDPLNAVKRRELNAVDREHYDELNKEIKDMHEDSGRSRRLPAVPSRLEIQDLLNTVKNSDGNNAKRDYMIIRLSYATGCRRSETAGIRLADIAFEEQRIFIRDGKGDKDRYVLIDKHTAKLLEKHTRGLRLQDPIFDIEDKQINRTIIKWGTESGLVARYDAQDRSFTSHSLRHAFATHMHESGVDLFVLKDLLGHKFLTTTRLYVQIGVGRRLANYESTHPLATGILDED
jgi:integrase